MPVILPDSTDASNKFEDLSGTRLPQTDNPYDALIEVCHGSPPTQADIQARYDLHRTTRNSQQRSKLLDANFPGVTLDLILQRLENPKLEPGYEDPRNCLVFWARPPTRIRELIGRIQKELRECFPNLWLMPLENLHMTTLEITHSRAADEITDIVSTIRQYIVSITDFTLTHRARLVKPMLSFDGAAIALSFLPASGEELPSGRGEDEDKYTYHHLRRDVYRLCQEAGAEVESRYTVPSAHLTVGRFITAADSSLPRADNDQCVPDPAKMGQWMQKIEYINGWLKDECWPSGEKNTRGGAKSVQWIVGEEKGLDCRRGALWYGGGETIRLGQGF